MSNGRAAEALHRLHREAETADRAFIDATMARIAASGATLEQAAAAMIAEERTDYRAIYRGHAGHFLSVSPIYGRFLYMIARAARATRIIEFGTSMGISTIYLAAALRDNGGGRLIGTELEPAKVARARANLDAAGLVDLVEIREGDALDTLGDVGGGGRPAAGRRRLLALPAGAQIGRAAVEARRGDPRGERLRIRLSRLCPQFRERLLSQPLPIDEGRGNEFTIRT